MAATLYLIPAPLGDVPAEQVIPAYNLQVIRNLRWFIAEEIRTARRFIKKACPEMVISDLTFLEYNEHTPDTEIGNLLEPLLKGHDTGLLSEAGLPCVADPGARITEAAHNAGITVKPLTGPSSVMLALMASGMNGQQFAFHGYLPADKNRLIRKLKEIEQVAFATGQTQIFIETPYRNMQMLQAVRQHCNGKLRLCVACDLTLSSEIIISKHIEDWKGDLPDINKRPAVFLLSR